MKRIFDIAGSVIGLIISAPLWPAIVAAIKLDSAGPVLVRLARVSKGKIIYAYKFRSMVNGAHFIKAKFTHLNERNDGPFFKIKEDPRLTKVGKWLRRYRLDEIPQLLNVLKGELALVGPRPHEPSEVIHYPGEYQHLMLAKSGVTGLSQVNGSSSLPFLTELMLDNHYVKNQSLWLDTQILAKTAATILRDTTAV